MAETISINQVNGTIPTRDKKALPSPQTEPLDLEDMLRELVADVLDIDIEDVTPESHFFELGGDSLATAELVAIARRQGLQLSRQLVFETPHISELAARISLSNTDSVLESSHKNLTPFALLDGDITSAKQLAAEQCEVSTEDIEDIYPTTALQAGLMARSVRSKGAYVSSWVIKVLQPVDAESLCSSLHMAVTKLTILRTALVTSAEHGFVQVVLPAPSGIDIVRVVKLSELDLDTRTPAMTLGKPLNKIEVVIAEDFDKHFVLWHAHHAVYDMSTLELVSQHISDVASGLNIMPTPPSFASFIAHTLDIRRDPAWKDFWLAQLRDCPTPFFPHGGQGDPATFRTNSRYTHNLPRIDAKLTFTLANLFRASWAYLLSCYEHSDDVVFGVTTGGRYAPVSQCAEIVGPTIATAPARIQLNQGSTITEFLQQVSMQAVHINSWEQVGLSNIQGLSQDGQKACSFRSLINVQVNDAGRHNTLWEPMEPDAAEPMDYALVLELFSGDVGDMRLRLSYDSSILRRQQIVQIAAQLENVVHSFSANPNQLLAEVNGMPPQGDQTSNTRLGAPEESTLPFALAHTPASQVRKHAAIECGVPEDAVQDVYPCTPMQADLVSGSLRHPTANVVQIIISIRDDLSGEGFCRAWAGLQDLHRCVPALRTRFFQGPPTVSDKALSSKPSMLQAVIEEQIPWTGWESLDKFLSTDRERSFGLGQALTRLALIHDPADGQVRQVVLTTHRAVCDDWTTQLMGKKLADALRGSVEIKSTPYSDFVQHVLQSSKLAARTFWAQMLEDSQPPSFPEVPVGHSPLTTASIPKFIALPMTADGPASAVTSSSFLQTAWALTISQYQDPSDIIFGSLLNGRSDEFDWTFGPTTSVVPLRVQIDNPDVSIGNLLQAVQERNVALGPYSYYGLSSIRNINECCDAAARFQNMLIVQESPKDAEKGGSCGWIKEVKVPAVVQNYALIVEVWHVEGTAMIRMSFDPSVLDQAQVQRLLSHYEHVLTQLAALPPASDSYRVKDVSHLPPDHLEELLSWNGNVPAPLERGVHELFQDQVAAQPDAPAVCARDGDWNYAELDELSEKLARSLRSLGVGPGTYVPLLFEKCGLAIIAMMAILKAGGASVALDPSHPPERLRGLIGGMGDCIVVCSSENHALAVDLGSRAFVLTKYALEHLAKQPSRSRLSEENVVDSNNPAFVLFTSGSTGNPKGILIPHRAFSSSIRGHGQVLRFTTGPGSRNFQFTAYTSDVSIGEIFTSLAVGSCVCVPSDWDRKNNIAGTIRDFDVNWAFFTPSVAALLQPAEVPCLRTMVYGGETATPENIKTWAPSLHLINSFGPAECSIWTHCIPRAVTLDDFGSNIGYGVGDATWIVDPTDWNHLLPIGAIGEMLIEGPNVADGYLNEPVKTADTFVHDPAWMPEDRKSLRLYRTGDLARFLPNGMVQFLGRRDHQVKVNGLRIELGEIEHQIRRLLPDDILVAVDAVQPAGSIKVLAAFIAPKRALAAEGETTDDNSSATSESQKYLSLLIASGSNRVTDALQGLESALSAILPNHMVPKAFVPLRDMPLTASAKTDRKVLKLLASMLSPEELNRLGGTLKDRQAPSTVMERVLARLWSEALSRSLDLDVNQNFFKIGGDSLSAMKLVSIARKGGVLLSTEQVFKYPILRDMAQAAVVTEDADLETLDHAHGSDLSHEVATFSMIPETVQDNAITAASEQLGVERSAIEDMYPSSALQEGLLALSQDARGTYVAQMVYELSADVNIGRFQSAWESVIEDWAILRTRFFQWHTAEGAPRLMQAVVKSKTKWLKARSLHDYLKIDKRDKMRLGDRMIRLATLQDRKDKKNYFVLTAHHAIYDGWMLIILLSAVRRAYLGLPELDTANYNVFIKHLETRDRERSQQFWQSYISGASRTSWPEFPTPDFRPSSTAVAKVTRPLPVVGDFTFATLMRTAFAILLGAYSHSDDVVFASTVHGRALGVHSAEKVAGPTLATVPVRVGIARGKLLHELLSAVQSEGAEMLEYEQEGMQNIKKYNQNALATIDSQSLLVVQVDPPPQNPAEAGLTMEEANESGLDNGFLSSALVLEAKLSADQMKIVATYDDRIISPLQAERFVRQLPHIVQQLCESDGKSSLADLDLVPAEDVDEMFSWNSKVPEPADALIHELFSAQAKEQPNVEALVSWEGSLTFQQVDELSGRLAGHLWTVCGLRSRIRVPLVFEKSIWTVVAMLAVLKIGSAYVALNPAHPPDRLRAMLEDVDANFVLCSEKHESLAKDIAEHTFCVGPSTLIYMGPAENGARDVRPDDHAFFLFTSGSTGKPKAIMIDHTAFCSSMRGHGETLCYRKGSRNLQYTAYTSDVSMGEIFTSLSRGATVCIPSDEERMNDLAGAMERMQVDWAFLTPSVASLLNPDHVPTLRTLLFGGETATPTNVKTWAPRLHLINSFGPAETSIWSHAHPHFTVNDEGSDIGWSVGGATWIVDPDDYTRLMPIGAIGELVFEGPNCAAGYYKNPEKTKAAFVDSLLFLPSDRRNRIYRLGDLARWLPDGRVQFLGRKDGQVKLHGQRIEVGEVEHNIRTALAEGGHELEVAVEMIKNPEELADSRLIAFISCTPADSPQDRDDAAIASCDDELERFAESITAGLKDRLATRLAKHMIPSFFIPVTSMPLNASAKTDRKHLRGLISSLSFALLTDFALASKKEVEQPQTAMEKLLHNMWCSILALPSDQFGIEADFFECGGDSIAAMKLASIARSAQLSLSVQEIYDHPQLGDLATTLNERAPRTDSALPDVPAFSLLPSGLQEDIGSLLATAADLCSVKPSEVSDIYPCTSTQQSVVARTLKRPGAFWLHNVFEIPAALDAARLEAAWQKVVESHIVLRTRIFKKDDQLLQAVVQQQDVLRHITVGSIERHCAADLLRPLTFGEPLVRAAVLTELSSNGDGSRRRNLVVTFHHSVYDVPSLAKIFTALEQAYVELADDGSARHIEMEYHVVDYKHFVKALLDQDTGLVADFWKKYLLGTVTKPLVDSPTDDARVNRVLRHKIDFPNAGAAKGTGNGNVTHAVMAYGALGLALHRRLQSRDTMLKLISVGRGMANVPDIADVVGLTVTYAPLRIIHADGEKDTLQDYLAHVSAQARRLAPFEQYGFKEMASVHEDAAHACASATQVVVHPWDPYSEQLAAGLGLKRRNLSAFSDDGAPVTVDMSLHLQGRVLEAIDVRIIFDNRVITENRVRSLLVDIDTITQGIAKALASRQMTTTVQDILGACEREGAAEVGGKQMTMERIEDGISSSF